MHEISITQDIIDSVITKLKNYKVNKVNSIKLQIGLLTALDPDSLKFSFDTLIDNTILKEARLIIEKIPLTIVCLNCNSESKVTKFDYICPICKDINIKTYNGNELNIIDMEVEIDEDN